MNALTRIVATAVMGYGELTRTVTSAVAAVGAVAASIAAARRTVSTASPPRTDPLRPVATTGLGGRNLPHAPADPDSWTAVRLKETLRTHLHGQRAYVLANREPVIHERNGDRIVIRHPASGLVTALEPVMRACSGVWVAHGGGSADRETADPQGRVSVGSDGTSYWLRRVWLTADEERGYYYGFANEALWPLCHLAAAQPIFRRDDWAHYQRVNQRFADAVASEIDTDEPIVLVQDYHFALAPRMLRERFPRATILTFWHIPWPNAERFAICPHQEALLDGLLGSSIVGFQTPLHCRNFIESVDRGLEARVEREDMAVVQHGRTTAVRAYPISVEWPNPSSTQAPSVDECRRLVRAEFDLTDTARLIVSVDRLDYTKGIEERLAAFERLLERSCETNESLAFIQVAAPSRTLIERYREFGDRIRTRVEQLNARYLQNGRQPVIFLNRHCEPHEIARYYRAADACYVSSLHDGMNVVAKEFVSARDDEGGVLVLSRFAGASRELSEALIVNPYDIDGVADALRAALTMPPVEQRERMRALRRQVASHNVYRWAGRMLLDAARVRDRQEIRRRLAGAPGASV